MSEEKWKDLEQRARDMMEVAELIGELKAYLRSEGKKDEEES